MNEEERRTAIQEFERNRQMLASMSQQKQQLTMQSEIVNASIKELENTTEKKVLKAVGNILVQKDTKEVKKELEERKESTELRLKTVVKQEEALLKKLNALKSQIENSMQQETSGKKKTKTKK